MAQAAYVHIVDNTKCVVWLTSRWNVGNAVFNKLTPAQMRGFRPRAVLKGPDFFFFAKDRPKGPPTATNRQPPTATNHQPPTAANRQRRPTANCQPLPTATNHQSPTTNRRQPPPTASCQLPTANRRHPPTANRHQPWLSTWSARGLFWENWFRNIFFFPVKDRPAPTRGLGFGAM